MRILYVITSTTIGGAERKLDAIIAGLDKNTFTTVGVISLKPAGPVAESILKTGVPVVSLDMGYIPSLSDINRLAAEIEKFKPDIVNAFLFRAIQFCRAAKTLKGLKFSLVSSTEVNYRTRSLPIRLIDRVLRRKDELTVCESKTSADYLITGLGYDHSRVKVARNGTDPYYWVFSLEERERIRKQLGVSKGEILVTSAGRLSRQKGHSFLVNAIAGINNPAGIKCVILGTGPEKAALEARIASKGLTEKVILAGEKDYIKPWLCASDIFVLPSLWEGIPIALLEAMAVGLPCVGTSVDGILEVIENGKNGLLCPPADANALANALIRLTEDVPLRNNISLAAKKTIRDEFNTKTMIRRYEEIYESVSKN